MGYSVKGNTISDIMSMNIETFNSLSEKDLKTVVSRLASAGNKRLRTFRNNNVSSPAFRYIERSGGNFSVKDKTVNQLRAEFVRTKNFLSSVTGSISGAKRVQKETIRELTEKWGIELSDKQYTDFWKAYEKLKEISPEVANKSLKYNVLQDISSMVEDGKNPEDIAVTISKQIAEIYEKQAEIDENEIDGVSGFFEI